MDTMNRLPGSYEDQNVCAVPSKQQLQYPCHSSTFNDISEKRLVENAPQLSTTTAQTASTKTETNPRSNDELTLQICGSGEMAILFPAETGSGTKGQGDVGKINLSLDTSTPVILKVPTSEGIGGVDIRCRGSINFHIESQGIGQTARSTNTTYTPDSSDTTEPSDTGQPSLKTHRRNNSDYLLVSGEPIHANTEARNQWSQTEAQFESASKDPRVYKTDHLLDSVDSVHSTAVKKTVTCTTETPDCVNRLNAEFTNLGRDWSSSQNRCRRVSLNGPIRNNLTYLLQEIRLVSLCDHLYQNQVIDMETYQRLFEGNRSCRTTQDGIRQLLMTLSCMKVDRVQLLKSLLESDHKDIIDMLLPRG